MKDKEVSQTGEQASARSIGRTQPSNRILLVDDDNEVRQLSATVLIRHGYEVEAVADGAAGWEALNNDNYDLLITDNKMPKLTGLELLKKLRESRMALPVIMATGTLPENEFARHPWLQPAATLVKPYTVAALLDKVKEVLREIDNASEQIAPPSDGPSQPSIDGWRL